MDEEEKEKEVSLPEALEAKTTEAREHASAEADAAHQVFEERLQALQSRAKVAESSYREAIPKAGEGRSIGMDAEQGRSLGVGISVAYGMLGMPVVMFSIGFLIDQAAHTRIWMAILGLLGFVMGVAYAIWFAQRSQQR